MPIIFVPDSRELRDPFGNLEVIKKVGAPGAGSSAAEDIEALAVVAGNLVEVHGKRELSASGTGVQHVLATAAIEELVFAGTITSICIDSTARVAIDRRFSATIQSDCTSSRTRIEQDVHCHEILPFDMTLTTSHGLLGYGAGQTLSASGVRGL